MRVHTRTEWQLTPEGMELILDEHYEYEGPVAQCGDAGFIFDPAGIGKNQAGGGGQPLPLELRNVIQESLDRSRLLFQGQMPLRGQLLRQAQRDVALAPVPLTTGQLGASPLFPALKQATEEQFARAREQAIGTTPRGGALAGQLGAIQGQRAAELSRNIGQIGQLELQRRQDALARAQNLLTGQAAASGQLIGGATGGAGTLGSIQSQLAGQQAEQQAAKTAGLGQLGGGIVGGIYGGPGGAAAGSAAGGAVGSRVGGGGGGKQSGPKS